MAKRTWANKVDANQKDIIKDLLKYPGVSVAKDHHDILVGFRGKTGWYEIKNTSQLDKDGNVYETAKKKSQKKLDIEWTGHREYATTADEILIDMGVIVPADMEQLERIGKLIDGVDTEQGVKHGKT